MGEGATSGEPPLDLTDAPEPAPAPSPTPSSSGVAAALATAAPPAGAPSAAEPLTARPPALTLAPVAPDAPLVVPPVADDGPANVLFIDGLGRDGTGSMSAALIDGRTDDEHSATMAWKRARITRRTLVLAPADAADAAAERCADALASGAFHALVVVDLSAEAAISVFEERLGALVQAFVRGGGRVAFPTTDGAALAPVLRRLFDTCWTCSESRDGAWGPSCNSKFGERFGQSLSGTFVSTAWYLRGVPADERFFLMKTREFVAQAEAAGATGGASEMSLSMAGAEFDVSVAVHPCGEGSVAFFGDACCAWQTCELVAAYASTPPPQQQQQQQRQLRALPPPPPPIERAVGAEAYAAALAAKAEGNTAFGKGAFEAAVAAYDAALAHFGMRSGSGAQKEERLRIHSNRAECCLRLQRWQDAADAASAALAVDSTHAKSRLRRAKALVRIEGQGIAPMRDAADDLELLLSGNGEGADGAATLLRHVQAQLKRAQAAADQGFKKGFGKALSAAGGWGPAAPPPGPPPPPLRKPFVLGGEHNEPESDASGGGGGGGGAEGGGGAGGDGAPDPPFKGKLDPSLKMWDPKNPSPSCPLYTGPDGLGGKFNGQYVRPVTRDVEKEKLPEMFDGIGCTFCGHGRELCGLCKCDRRLVNEVKRAQARGEDFSVYGRLYQAHSMREEAELAFLKELHKARYPEQRFRRGTLQTWELQKEIQDLLSHQLPPWPPPRVGPIAPPQVSREMQHEIQLERGF